MRVRVGGHEGEKLEDVYRTLRDLGKIFGVSDQAERRVEQMQQQVAEVRAKVTGKPPVKVVFYYQGTSPLTVARGAGIYASCRSKRLPRRTRRRSSSDTFG